MMKIVMEQFQYQFQVNAAAVPDNPSSYWPEDDIPLLVALGDEFNTELFEVLNELVDKKG